MAVERWLHREFIAKFDAQGAFTCPCGQTHRLETRRVIAGEGALLQSAELLTGGHGSPSRLWVLSDERTEAAAGTAWKAALRGPHVVSRILPGHPKPEPTEELARSLAEEARAASADLLVAIGSGVVSDLVKRASLHAGAPNWCIGTAASVDAYTSATAAIRINGFHSAARARISETVVCDIGVIADAPREMLFAGLGDLLAKYLAHLDWNLSRIVAGEHYCPVVASVALESARGALGAARVMRTEPREAMRRLTDAALSSGLAMQATGGSRPAASAEHTLAHFWETVEAVRNERFDLHGILVGAASRIVLRSYRALYDRLTAWNPDEAERLRSWEAEPGWEQGVEPGLLPYMAKIREEMAERQMDRGRLAGRLSAFRAGRQEILRLAGGLLSELEAAVVTLEALGFPFSVEDLGIEPRAVLLPFRNIRLLRRRYSGFDLAYELGLEDVLRDEAERGLNASRDA
jgi:glycerol-1-phosphate dehydrogenase [NAD(P)+]